MNCYAGIGSRKTPTVIQQRMTVFAHGRLLEGYTLRSGGADGADIAFESGAADLKEIFLPYDGFNNKRANGITIIDALTLPTYEEARYIAKQYHPKWASLDEKSRRFHTRNVYQVLGADLNTPIEMVACWTVDRKASGGTGQAIRIALAKDIPVYYF